MDPGFTHRGARIDVPGDLHFDGAAFRLVTEVLAMSRPGLAAGLRKQVPALQASLGHEWAAVTTAASALDESFAGLAATALTPGDAQLLLKRLAAAAQPGEFPDYASEEQIVMAIPVLGAHGGRPTRSAAVTELLESRKDDDHFGAQRFRRLLEQASR